MKNATVFDLYGRYYDLMYRDKDYVAEVNYINSLLKSNGMSGNELLEFGSGTGRHGRLLVDRGYTVTGIERSAEMVKQSEVIEGFSCQQGDICTIHMGRTYGAVLSLFHVISYQVGNIELRSVFERAAEHLSCGGLFIFDVWYSAAVNAQVPEVRVKRMADGDLSMTRIAEPVVFPNESRVDVSYTIFIENNVSGTVQTFKETHSMRHFSLQELDLHAEMNGFERVVAEAFLTGDAPSEDTWGVCLVLRKK